MRAIGDKEFFSGGVTAVGGDGEAGVGEGDGAVILMVGGGGVVEEVDERAEDHGVVGVGGAGATSGGKEGVRRGGEEVEAASVDDEPGVDEGGVDVGERGRGGGRGLGFGVWRWGVVIPMVLVRFCDACVEDGLPVGKDFVA